MKPIFILFIAGLAAAALYLGLRKSASASTGTASASDEQAKIILTDTTTAPGAPAVDVGSSLGAGQASTSSTNKAAADALATGQAVDSGFAVENLYGLEFVREQNIAVGGGLQSIFKLNKPSQTRIDNPVGFSFSTKPYSPGKFREPDTFVEILPSGSGSTALNVVESGISRHPGEVKTAAVLKPSDPGYNAALENARARVAAAQAKPAAKTTTSTVKLGSLEMKGKESSPSNSGSGKTVTTKTASGKGQVGTETGHRKVTIRAGDQKK